MKKLLLFGYYGEDNLGDDLLLESLIDRFSPKFDLGVLTKKNNKEEFLRAKIFNKFSIDALKGIIWSDIVIGGGGGIFQDKTSLRSFYYYFSIVFLSILLKKRVFLLGQSFSPLRYKVNEVFLAKVLNRCDAVYVRDSFSKNYLEKIGVKPYKIRLSTDLSLLIDFPIPTYNHNESSILGINLRSWNKFSFKEDLENFIINIYEKFDKVYFFIFQPEDYKIYEEIPNQFKSKVLPISPKDSNFWNYYSSCSLFVGMRLHSCIISMSLGIPFVAITYDEKVRAFCEEINWKYFLDSFDFDKVLGYIKELEKDSLEHRKFLLTCRDLLREKIKKDMEYFERELCLK